MIRRKNFDKNTIFVLIFVDFSFRSNHNQLFRYTTFNVPKIFKDL